MKVKGPIEIKCDDIYLEFPEIMKEEFNDLMEFCDDNKIICTGATKRFKDMQKEIVKLKREVHYYKNNLHFALALYLEDIKTTKVKHKWAIEKYEKLSKERAEKIAAAMSKGKGDTPKGLMSELGSDNNGEAR